MAVTSSNVFIYPWRHGRDMATNHSATSSFCFRMFQHHTPSYSVAAEDENNMNECCWDEWEDGDDGENECENQNEAAAAVFDNFVCRKKVLWCKFSVGENPKLPSKHSQT